MRKSHRVFLKIKTEPEFCALVHKPSMSYFNTEHSHLYTKSLTRSSFSHFNSSNSQRPQVTLQERNNAFKIVLFVFFLGLGYFFFTVSLDLSWIMLFYLEWQIFCSLPLPTELLGNVLIARRFPFPMQLWTADSSFKQPAPKCRPSALKKQEPDRI